jgi:hypothetical protein
MNTYAYILFSGLIGGAFGYVLKKAGVEMSFEFFALFILMWLQTLGYGLYLMSKYTLLHRYDKDDE